MKVIFTIVVLTVVYIFSMVNLEVYRNESLNDIIIPDINVENGNTNTENIVVEVEGEVLRPGKYEFVGFATFNDLIKKCGLKSSSAEDCINLNCPLTNNEMYYIPKASESKISINTAKKDSLMLLPGVGEATSDRIIAYRRKNHFNCLEDLMKVDGIKKMTFNKLRDHIKL